MALLERFKNAWNAFSGRDPTPPRIAGYSSFGSRPDYVRLRRANARTVIASVYNQIAVDVSSVDVHHVRLDEEDRFTGIINDSLNTALSRDANIDQTGRTMIRDICLTMMDEGCAVAAPVITDGNPLVSDSYKVECIRVGTVKEWFPKEVRVELYDELTGTKKQIVLPKRIVAIIENPFYTIMNEPNSTAQRLIRVLSQIDRLNEENSSGKLDMIIQLPYMIKSDARREQAKQRKRDLEEQLTGSKYGIAYIDGTEKIMQLNKSIENNLWQQAMDLKTELFSQLGFSQTILDGSATEEVLLNYNNRIVEPILSAITEEMERKWLSQTAIAQHQAIRFYREPFKAVPLSKVAELADVLTRNEIVTANEFRSFIGLKPSDDPKANELWNSNNPHPEDDLQQMDEDVPQLDTESNNEDDSEQLDVTLNK